MSFQRDTTSGGLWEWMALLRASNTPTVLADCAVGLAMTAAIRAQLSYPGLVLDGLFGVVCSMCAIYFAGMVLNAIVDRDVDAIERPMRPVASGRIRLAAAWTAFIALLTVGLSLGVGMTSGIVPLAVAALIGVWTLERAKRSQSTVLHRIGRVWVAVSLIGGAVWIAMMLLSDPFDLRGFEADRAQQIRIGWRATTIPVLLLSLAAVAYNLLHKRTAWSVLLLAACRFLVPISVCTALLARTGALDTRLLSMNAGGVLAILLLPPLAIALHTLMLSIVARRETDSHFTEARCARCGHQLHAASATRCSECGCDLTAHPPICSRPIPPTIRAWLPFIAAVGLVPGLLLLAVSVRDSLGLHIVILALAGVAALCFVWVSRRGLIAALNHPSRRPAGVAALIAALAMLDAFLCAVLGQPLLLVVCVACWFATRLLHRRAEGS